MVESNSYQLGPSLGSPNLVRTLLTTHKEDSLDLVQLEQIS
jgi:hypothetical protein